MNKLDIINELIEKNGFQSYLEIGLGDGRNFKGVNIDYKVGVDPDANEVFGHVVAESSDDFFSKNESKFDLIFIDGLHHAEQVEKDIINSWNALNTGGIILIHDVKPEDEAMTIVPRKQNIWTGDVFKVWHGLNQNYPKIKTAYIDEQWGMGLIYKSRHKIEPGFISDINFSEYYKAKGWEPKEG